MARLGLTLLVVFVVAAGCARPLAPPPILQEPPPGAEVQRIFVATQHGDLTRFRTFGNPRQSDTRYFMADISVPPGHVAGQIETARRPDPNKHFALVGGSELDANELVRALRNAQGDTPLVGIFVHGYNTNLIKASLRVAQISTDFDVPFPIVAYAWPSSGEVRGYVYDRDSALFARDGLERLIRRIHGDTGQKVVLIAHSMGALLTMEALRQLSVDAPGQVNRMVEDVILVSPDIDPDVFRAQLRRIQPLPQPFLVLGTENDQALRLSSLLTGTRARLGSLERSADLQAMGVTFVDVGPLASGRALDHNVAFQSPEGMQALIRQLERDF